MSENVLPTSSQETMMPNWIQKRRAAKADRAFRDALKRSVRDRKLMESLSPERQHYAFLATNAMDWWIRAGQAGKLPPESPALAGDAAPRDKIIIAYLGAHPDEDLGLALRAIAAQARHLEQPCPTTIIEGQRVRLRVGEGEVLWADVVTVNGTRYQARLLSTPVVEHQELTWGDVVFAQRDPEAPSRLLYSPN